MSLAATSSGVLRVLPFPVASGFDQDTFFDRVASRDRLARAIAEAVVVVVVGSAAYGATFGLWRSGLLALYVAIKLPLLLLATSGLVMVLNWMLAQLMSSGLGFDQVAAL